MNNLIVEFRILNHKNLIKNLLHTLTVWLIGTLSYIVFLRTMYVPMTLKLKLCPLFTLFKLKNVHLIIF